MEEGQVQVRIYWLKRAGFRRTHGAWQRGPWRVAMEAAQDQIRIYRLKRAGFRRKHHASQRGLWRVA